MRKLLYFSVIMLLVFSMTVPVAAVVVPYESYNYDYWEDMVFTPAPYIPARNISGATVGAGSFSRPNDLAIGPNGRVYVADTGNNRIVILNPEMTETVGIIETFDNDGTLDRFNEPFGLTVSPENLLYIADTMNERIVVLKDRDDDLSDDDFNMELVKIVRDPQSEMFDSNFAFVPMKLTVDFAGRIYVVPRGSVEGIMVFDPNGDFTGYVGTINVQISPWQIFWRSISTRAQLDRGFLIIPTEFTGVDIDPDGFVYATNIDPVGEKAVRRLNPTGEDVIRTGENQNLGGDLVNDDMGLYGGPSVIVDVVYRERGIYSLLDSKRGRIFTYDHEGNLLYIFGGRGSQVGTFRQPVAIEYLGGCIAVLDATYNEIITFDVTLYGSLINEAVGLRYDGDESQAVEKWHEVLVLNGNLELANVGIGKAYLTAGDNVNAMKYLELGKNRTFYSIAYQRYRNEILKENMPYIFTGIVVIIAALVVFMYMRKGKEKGDS
ncbi:MAG: NHL repeat-containing protein [Oscillospiraceae bacterium]|nr:NHL repeat-containing protein [Oscillospiraceae bacterium]